MTALLRSRLRVRPNVFAAFVIAVSIVLLGGCISVILQRNQCLDSKLSTRLSSVRQLFMAEIDREANLIEARMDTIVKNLEIREAWKKRDREQLLTLALPYFMEFQSKHGLSHFYFIDPANICFLFWMIQ